MDITHVRFADNAFERTMNELKNLNRNLPNHKESELNFNTTKHMII